MAIDGNKREPLSEGFVRKVGWAVCEPLIVNPTRKELEELLQKEVEKEPEYLSLDEDRKPVLSYEVWLREVKTSQRFKLKIKLSDKVHKLPNGKMRFVDTKGNTSYFLDHEDNLVDWMKENNPRVAKEGEVELYKFLRAHQGMLKIKEIRDFTIDWSRLMRGDVKEINDLKQNMFATNVLVALAVRVDRRDGELKHYQSVYNRAFLAGDYARYLRIPGSKKPKPLLDFINEVTDKEHGCRDFFGKDRILREMHDYDPAENPLATDNAVLAGEHEDDVTMTGVEESEVAVSTDY